MSDLLCAIADYDSAGILGQALCKKKGFTEFYPLSKTKNPA